jgi:hypothetical protein
MAAAESRDVGEHKEKSLRSRGTVSGKGQASHKWDALACVFLSILAARGSTHTQESECSL